MDLHPTIGSPDLQTDLENRGALSPPPTPVSVSASEDTHRGRSGLTTAADDNATHRRAPIDFIAHSHSPLHANLPQKHPSVYRRKSRRLSTSSSSSGAETSRRTSQDGPPPRPSTSTPDERALEAGLAQPELDHDESLTRAPSRRASGRRRKESRRERKARKRAERAADREERRSIRARLRESRWNPVLVLKNSGAVARDHLATERTYLAYIRTSLGLASMGVALVQLFTIADLTSRATGAEISPATRNISRFAKPLGATTIALAMCTLLQGVWRFFKIQKALPQGVFPIARVSAAFTGFVFAAIIATIFGAILSGRTQV